MLGASRELIITRTAALVGVGKCLVFLPFESGLRCDGFGGHLAPSIPTRFL
jgi:hypothetical protein